MTAAILFAGLIPAQPGAAGQGEGVGATDGLFGPSMEGGGAASSPESAFAQALLAVMAPVATTPARNAIPETPASPETEPKAETGALASDANPSAGWTVAAPSVPQPAQAHPNLEPPQATPDLPPVLTPERGTPVALAQQAPGGPQAETPPANPGAETPIIDPRPAFLLAAAAAPARGPTADAPNPPGLEAATGDGAIQALTSKAGDTPPAAVVRRGDARPALPPRPELAARPDGLPVSRRPAIPNPPAGPVAGEDPASLAAGPAEGLLEGPRPADGPRPLATARADLPHEGLIFARAVSIAPQVTVPATAVKPAVEAAAGPAASPETIAPAAPAEDGPITPQAPAPVLPPINDASDAPIRLNAGVLAAIQSELGRPIGPSETRSGRREASPNLPGAKPGQPSAPAPHSGPEPDLGAVEFPASQDAPETVTGNVIAAPGPDVEAPPVPKPAFQASVRQEPVAPAAASPQPLTSHAEGAAATEETAPRLASQILESLGGARASRFQIELDPAGLGKVDVRVQISASGQLTAALSFENPHAAHELRARAPELQAALQQAGFDVSRTSLHFDTGQHSGHGQGGLSDQHAQREQRQAPPGPAFADLADTPETAPVPARVRAGGVDVRI